MKDVKELSIPELEYLLQGCNKNNKDMEKYTSSNKTYEGADAIQYLMNSGDIT